MKEVAMTFFFWGVVCGFVGTVMLIRVAIAIDMENEE